MPLPEIDEAELGRAIQRLWHSPGPHDYDNELLTAANFVADYGTLGELFDKNELTRMQMAASGPAAWSQLGHWSTNRNDPGSDPAEPRRDAGFLGHCRTCKTCSLLESIVEARCEFLEQQCDECGTGLTDHELEVGGDNTVVLGCPNVWQRCEPYVAPGGDSMGGDRQWSDAHEARWTAKLSDGTYALVTRYYYEAREINSDGDHTGDVFIERCDEYLVCHNLDDPGGTEVNSELVYTELEKPETMNTYDLAMNSFTPDGPEWMENAPEFARYLLVAGAIPAAA